MGGRGVKTGIRERKSNFGKQVSWDALVPVEGGDQQLGVQAIDEGVPRWES